MGALARASVYVSNNSGDRELIVRAEQHFIGIDGKKLLASVVAGMISSAFYFLGVVKSGRGVS